ncbi:hypothetical protein L1987_54135 [Smallanthus sonchifolius]|uniref:Uncharacterized protein n=1 Tax=Smallanthus sonchifolius TaxID=185202 RepID=A0ACB9E6Z2_9ASTR|nr:hypothetical protein L1987_54135 [Smallanthus sonchifolius]
MNHHSCSPRSTENEPPQPPPKIDLHFTQVLTHHDVGCECDILRNFTSREGSSAHVSQQRVSLCDEEEADTENVRVMIRLVLPMNLRQVCRRMGLDVIYPSTEDSSTSRLPTSSMASSWGVAIPPRCVTFIMMRTFSLGAPNHVDVSMR